jgi:sodium-dependent dicarboxylate transporter 2/3/5
MERRRVVQLGIALLIGLVFFVSSRLEGTRFQVLGDPDQALSKLVKEDFTVRASATGEGYVLELKIGAEVPEGAVPEHLENTAARAGQRGVTLRHVDGLESKGKLFICLLAVIVFLFVAEPVPLEITGILIGVFLSVLGITDIKGAWAPYMHPVVLFSMACLAGTLAFDKAGLTRRLAFFITRRAGVNPVRFTFFFAISLGLASCFVHDAAATSIGLFTLVPLMKAAGIKPHSNTAKFMVLSLPFACSAGGMGTLIGGGRCMLSAAFLGDLTGGQNTLSFAGWALYCLPAALVCVPLAVLTVYLVFNPKKDGTACALPVFENHPGPWSGEEKKTAWILTVLLAVWLSSDLHGLDYSVTGMLGIAALVLSNTLKWEDIHANLEWGATLFVFGGCVSLGLAMESSGAAKYFSSLLLPLFQGAGWPALFLCLGVLCALLANIMPAAAAAAMLLPVAIRLAMALGVNPVVTALCTGTMTSLTMLLAIGCPANAIAQSYRFFKPRDLSRAGAFVTPVLVGVLFVVAAVWWKTLGLL